MNVPARRAGGIWQCYMETPWLLMHLLVEKMKLNFYAPIPCRNVPTRKPLGFSESARNITTKISTLKSLKLTLISRKVQTCV